MSTVFLSVAEKSLPMFALVIIMAAVSKGVGAKFTAKCRYLIWVMIIALFVVPISTYFVSPIFSFEIPSENIYANERQTITEHNNSLNFNLESGEKTGKSESIGANYNTSLAKRNHLIDFKEISVLTLCILIWLLGSVIYFFYKIISYIVFYYEIKKYRRKIEDQRLLQIYDEKCKNIKLRHPPKLYSYGKIGSPMVLGFINPAVILPTGLDDSLSFGSIIAHELTHYKRCDLWIKLISLLAISINWFNPAVYIAVKFCDREMELSCDEAVLSGLSEEERREYGYIILDVIKKTNYKSTVLTTYFNPKNNNVKKRIKNIIDTTKKKRSVILIVVFILIGVLSGTLLACNIIKTHKPNTDDTKIEDTTAPPDTTTTSPDSTTEPEEITKVPIETTITQPETTIEPKEGAITNIENWTSLGLATDDLRKKYIEAFLEKDIKTVEYLTLGSKGMYSSYQSLKFGKYYIWVEEGKYKDEVVFKFEITQSNVDLLPVGTHTYIVSDGDNPLGTHLTRYKTDSYTSAQTALRCWWSVGGYLIKWGNTSELYNYHVGDYIISANNAYNEGMPEDQLKEYAKIYFGIDNYVPIGLSIEDGRYNLQGHGAVMRMYEFIDEKTVDGITTVTVRFFADASCTITSHTVEYKMQEYNLGWIFLGSVITKAADYEPFYFGI